MLRHLIHSNVFSRPETRLRGAKMSRNHGSAMYRWREPVMRKLALCKLQIVPPTGSQDHGVACLDLALGRGLGTELCLLQLL